LTAEFLETEEEPGWCGAAARVVLCNELVVSQLNCAFAGLGSLQFSVWRLRETALQVTLLEAFVGLETRFHLLHWEMGRLKKRVATTSPMIYSLKRPNSLH
jgi:hypothetical protein